MSELMMLNVNAVYANPSTTGINRQGISNRRKNV